MAVVASKVPFADLCTLCEKISKKQGNENKQKILRDFIFQWRDFHIKLHKNDGNTTDSMYGAMRLLLPHLDKERGAYGIKEHTLAKLYIDLLCLNKNGEDAQKLLKYRTPNAKSEAGDFASVAYFILKSRCPDKGTLYIEDVNKHLDAVALSNAEGKKDEVKKHLLALLRNTSALEQKWLIRMIIKEMKFGLSEQSVLNLYHPDAKEFYDVTNNLHKVCTVLKDPQVRLHEIDVSLMCPFRPMLAERADIDKIEKLMQGKQLYTEIKFDGERMQLHKNGHEYMYFSRSGNDYTQNFGGNCKSGTFTPHIHQCFSANVKNCILDGEMVGYNIAAKCIGSKAENFDVKNLKDGDNYQQCYCVFDIVMFNSKVLTGLPLHERLNYIKDIFTEKEDRIQLAIKKEISTRQEVIDALNVAIDNREEGIILKDPESIYKPNTRKGGWYKVKPEYVEELMDQLDLIIIGGYFGEGRRSRIISHFMLGVAVPSSNPGEKPSVFHSFCRVGSGYTYNELFELCAKLNEYWKPYSVKNPPSNVVLAPGHKEKPDLWIEPSNSQIVQVKAAEITSSGQFKTGCTLRFPRVEKVRYDKSWHECLTTVELEEIRQQAAGKLATHRFEDLDTEGSPSKKKRRAAAQIAKPVTVAAQFQGIDTSNIEKISEIFKDKEMCVLGSPPDYTAQKIMELIVQHGGSVVQNPGLETFCVLTHRLGIKVQNIIKSNRHDVVKTEWLLKCIDEKKFIQWTPAYMIHMTRSTAKKFSKHFDRYGDSYTEPVSHEDLRRIFEEVEKQGMAQPLNQEEIAELELEYFPNNSPLGLFRLCRSYLDLYLEIGEPSTKIQGNSLEITEQLLKFYGSSVSSKLTENITHVIINSRDLERLQSFRELNRERSKKFHIVTEEWVTDSIKANRLLNERTFEPE